jgi:hypothetical protein
VRRINVRSLHRTRENCLPVAIGRYAAYFFIRQSRGSGSGRGPGLGEGAGRELREKANIILDDAFAFDGTVVEDRIRAVAMSVREWPEETKTQLPERAKQ